MGEKFRHLPFATLGDVVLKNEEKNMDQITDPILKAGKVKGQPAVAANPSEGEPSYAKKRKAPNRCGRCTYVNAVASWCHECPKCKENKPLENFYFDKGDGHTSWCIACFRASRIAREGKGRSAARKKPSTVKKAVKHASGLTRISKDKLEASAEGAMLILSLPKKESIAKMDSLIEEHASEVKKLRMLRKVRKALP